MNGETNHGGTEFTEFHFSGENFVRKVFSKKKSSPFSVSPWFAIAFFSLSSVPSVSSAQALVDYQRQVRPLIEKHCLECHSQDKRKGGLSLATYEDALEGGRNGAVIRPGNGARQPARPSRARRRRAADAEGQGPADVRADRVCSSRWIDQGARVTPTSARAPQPWEAPLELTRPVLPRVVWPSWNAPLDRHVASYLLGRPALYKSASPLVGPAQAPPLVSDALFARRAYLDVWGLLPTPEQLQAFLADAGPGEARRARRRRSSPTTTSTRSTGSRSGTICCATRTASRTSRKRPAARASPTGCAARWRRTCRTTSSSRSC